MDNKVKMHTLKIQEPFFYDVLTGVKKAELRKNDRDFRVGDLIHFTDVDGYEYMDAQRNSVCCLLAFKITHVLDAAIVIPNLKEMEYVILSIERVG